MEVKPGYKRTEAGVIPEDWEVSTVGIEFEIKLGKMLDSEKNTGVPKPYLGNKVVQWGRIDSDNLPMVPMSHSDLERFRLRQGDLLVCEGGEVGRAAIWEAPIDECYYQKALHRLRPLHHYNTRLLLAFLRYWKDQEMLSNYVSQTSIAHLTREKLAEVPIPVPSQDEQHAITTTLSDVDTLLEALDRLIAKKRDLKQAAMQQLLTGQTRLPGFHDDWELKQLGDVAHINMGQSPDSRNYNQSGIGIPLIQGNADIENRKSIKRVWTTQITKTCDEGDLILTVRAPVGSIGVASEHSCLGRGVCSLKPINAHALFLFHAMVFVESQWKILEQGSTFTAANSAQIAEFPLMIASTLEEQTAIAAILSDMDAELAALEQRRDKTRALKQAMMQELLTGKTRLISPGDAHA
jgi:type I restriction enzyme, S subunit